MKISECVAPLKAFSSYMIMVTHISSCSRSLTPFSNCTYPFSPTHTFLKNDCSPADRDIGRPGDYLKPGEDEIDGLKRRLDDRLAPPNDSRQFNASHGVNNEWEIGDCLAQWWRPNFETFMVRGFFSFSVPRHVNFIPRILNAVSIHPCPHHKTERMQKVVPTADARTKYVCMISMFWNPSNYALSALSFFV
jgi:hypothetical protein